MHTQTTPVGVHMATHPIPDPRDPHMRLTSAIHDSAQEHAEYQRTKLAARQSAKEALTAICDGFPDGFNALLARDRLVDIFGTQVLDAAFNDLLSERRR